MVEEDWTDEYCMNHNNWKIVKIQDNWSPKLRAARHEKYQFGQLSVYVYCVKSTSVLTRI